MMDGDTAELSSHEIIRLTDIPSGTLCKLVRVDREYGRLPGAPDQSQKGQHGARRILRRLLDLGITTGCEFKVIQGGGHGPVLLQVRGTRVALGHGLAGKLLVRVVE